MSDVRTARRVIDELATLARSLEERSTEYDAMAESEARFRREAQESAEALAELRAAYDALLGEYEAKVHSLRELEQANSDLLVEREQATGGLEAVIRRLRG
jgi:chromosome segregation ATPase